MTASKYDTFMSNFDLSTTVKCQILTRLVRLTVVPSLPEKEGREITSQRDGLVVRGSQSIA